MYKYILIAFSFLSLVGSISNASLIQECNPTKVCVVFNKKGEVIHIREPREIDYQHDVTKEDIRVRNKSLKDKIFGSKCNRNK